MIHLREILQPSPSISNNNASPHCCGYSLDAVLLDQPKKSVTIFIGTPLLLPSPISSTSAGHLTCSESNVVIKACLVKDKSLSILTPVDDPQCEVAAFQHLDKNHPNLIHLIDAMVDDDDNIYLVFPYLSGGDLFSRVDATDGQGLPVDEARHYFKQIIEGLLFMKRTGFAHNDVSLENVMRSSGSKSAVADLNVKLIDLGMCLKVPTSIHATRADDDGTTLPSLVVLLRSQGFRGKQTYVSPERLRSKAYDPFSSDIWSLGICCFTLLTGRPLYTSPSDRVFAVMSQPKGIQRVLEHFETYGVILPPIAKDLVITMLEPDPSKRPTLEDLLQHPFVTNSSSSSSSTCCSSSGSISTCSSTSDFSSSSFISYSNDSSNSSRVSSTSDVSVMLSLVRHKIDKLMKTTGEGGEWSNHKNNHIRDSHTNNRPFGVHKAM